MLILSVAISPSAEAALLEGCRSADRRTRQTATNQLLEQLTPSLLALCVNTLGNISDAEDALQESLIAIYSGLSSFRGESSVSTWAYRIAIRVSMRVAAKRTRQPVADERTCDVISQASQLSTARLREVLTSLSNLPAKHRVILSLFAIQGLSHAQIANILDIPEGTVWSRLHNARTKLLSSLQQAEKQKAA